MSLFKSSSENQPLIVLQYLFFSLILLYWGRPLLIPICVALLVSFILYPLCRWLEKHSISRVSAIFIALTFTLILVFAFLALLSYQFAAFMKEWPQLSHKLDQLISQIDKSVSESWLKVFLDPDEGLIGTFIGFVSENVVPLIPRTIYQSSITMLLLVLIPIYVALILYYRDVLVAFLYKIFPETADKYIRDILPDVIVTYYNFIKGMGLVYLIVAILNSIGLALLGIPNPIFFGFVASILTFIPYVGITIGALMPMAVAWLTYDSIFYPLGVVAIFVVVQILEANVIFPLAVSNRLKINALVTLIVIIGGGVLWGAMGMILFLPLAAIFKLVADQVEDLEAISVLLGTREDIAKSKNRSD